MTYNKEKKTLIIRLVHVHDLYPEAFPMVDSSIAGDDATLFIHDS